MDLLLEVPDDPPTLLNIHGNTFLLRPCLGDKPALGDGFVLALVPGDQVLHGSGHGHGTSYAIEADDPRKKTGLGFWSTRRVF